MKFVGRGPLMLKLNRYLGEVAESGTGRLLVTRGRRQVGKSRLFTEFLDRSGVPNVYFTAVKQATLGAQLDALRRDVLDAQVPLPEADTLFQSTPSSWTDALGRIRLAAQQGPVVVVFDEFPWAAEADSSLEGALQVAWDRHLQHLPVLVVLIGSDVTMMGRLTQHDRPLYGRGQELEVSAFNPAEVALALGEQSAVHTFDAHLVTGGYPRLVADLARAGGVEAYLRTGLSEENSNLIVVAERSLSSEFPTEVQARRVLSAIGGHEVGHATFTNSIARLGDTSSATATMLTRALKTLQDDKGILAIETPAGRDPSARLRRYRIADPYLRFWFRFIEAEIPNIARGRADLALNAIKIGFDSWRELAIEPIVHESLLRLAPSIELLADTAEVGAWWNRDHSVQVDVVASSTRHGVGAIGSIKWRERRAFSAEELGALGHARSVVPGAGSARLIAVCPAGVRPRANPDLTIDAEGLLSAWSA